jgi:hypothetical protein
VILHLSRQPVTFQSTSQYNKLPTFANMDPIILYASGLVIYEVLRTLEQNRVAIVQIKTDIRLKTQHRR